jgi:hypothetical protein
MMASELDNVTYVCQNCHASSTLQGAPPSKTPWLLVTAAFAIGAVVCAALRIVYVAAGLAVVAVVMGVIASRIGRKCPKCGSTRVVEADSAPLTTKTYRKK